MKAPAIYKERVLNNVANGFFALQIPLTVLGIGYYSQAHDWYAALEPSLLLGLEGITYLGVLHKRRITKEYSPKL